ncbi:hypothetical protein P7D92_10050 [Enterococcus dongliensis]|uniref:hypothetical protein n=1 Tax=Enterococcus dongliensis TaxID=2559925 RepID=UPI002891F8FB|nr:hypothetical protein [Enterococcus dongliensis]MDT2677295.1 hypothetical protein [Enterococcus dongliensis]
MKTINIFGEYIEGEEVEYTDQPYKNIIIVEDNKGDKHVVHRDTVDVKHKRTRSRAGVRFDLLACQANGRKGPIRKWRRIG